MNIKEYLKIVGISQDRASKQLDVSTCYMNQVCLGNKIPSKKFAKKIEDWSRGNVTMQDLIPEKKICPCCKRLMPAQAIQSEKKLLKAGEKAYEYQENGEKSYSYQNFDKVI